MIDFLKRSTLFHALPAAFCLIATFPPWDQGWLAAIALIPLLLFCRRHRPARCFGLGLLFGLVSQVGIFIWIFRVPGFRFYHALPLAIYLSLYPALWCAALSLWRRQSSATILLLAPALWVALSYIRGHAGFLALPWAGLAASQHNCLPLLQMASLTGAAGITFILVLLNSSLAESLYQRGVKPLLPVLLILPLISLWGVRQLHRSRTPVNGLQVAVVQPAITLSERKTETGRATSRARLKKLTVRAAAAGAQLVVWPETALRNLSHDLKLQSWLQELLKQTGVQLLLGTSEFFKFSRPLPDGDRRKIVYRTHNSACFFKDEKTEPLVYHKIILVPFGEYRPGSPARIWPKWLVPDFIETSAGSSFTYFTLIDGHRLAPIICWENLFGNFVRRFVKGGADYIVNISNDNWFGPNEARQHNLASVLRAVENRMPVIVASNTGPSEIIDACGRVTAGTNKIFGPALVYAAIQPSGIQTWYTRYGNFFTWGCILLAGAGLISSLIEWLTKKILFNRKNDSLFEP